jgi:hypothetical protein
VEKARLPATDAAIGMMNQLTNFLLTPRKLPKLDFSKGLPANCTTMVVVPTLFLNEEQTRHMVQDLEIRYLANRDAHLHFALLTDAPDSLRPFDEKDQLVDLCSTLIQDLNNKYGGQGKGTFFLLYRHRSYNAAEGKWMGWERKRGKLLDFNNLLRNNGDNFPVKIGDLSVLPGLRYVITLDSDIQLPQDAAHKLVGTLAHPLNRAVVDAGTNTVIEGYGILQPKIGMSVQSSVQSRLASLYAGETVLDNYAHAVSKEALTLEVRLHARLEHDAELRWWLSEMLRRLQSVRRMTEALAPWVLPEYRELCEHCELQLAVSLPGLTLDALPAFIKDLDTKLQEGLRHHRTLPGLLFARQSLREHLPACAYNASHLWERLHGLAEAAGALIEEMDFGLLFNARRKLLSTGYNASDRRVEKSCYDLLASEARLATFIAIAKGDISQESWFQLGRDHTSSMGERVLLSWTGTMFEYLMPLLWMKCYPHTIHEQSLHAVVQCQQQYGRNHGVPWGISESAYSDRGPQGEYLYRAFGLPALALDPNLQPDVVIAPYATCLALMVDAQNALKNLRVMHDMNWLGQFGFYEAADYRRSWGKPSPTAALIRCWMAHHQGMSLLAICNLLTHGAMQRLFHQ